jgi:hypothetical protein
LGGAVNNRLKKISCEAFNSTSDQKVESRNDQTIVVNVAKCFGNRCDDIGHQKIPRQNYALN